ncbi:hypothetical protein GGS20DRAFT_316392 [Poronia punctata]|nr:hypothetical protein GGS20DRAFT_316392 [Poronia punctata]
MAQTFLFAKQLAISHSKPGVRNPTAPPHSHSRDLQRHSIDDYSYSPRSVGAGPGYITAYSHPRLQLQLNTPCQARRPPQMEVYVPRRRPSLLLQLPLELFLQLWESLDVGDALSLRLVCRHIEALLFESFREEFFSERRVSITYHSLKVLTDISKCPRLKNCVTSLIVGLDRFHSCDARIRGRDLWTRFNSGPEVASEPVVKDCVDPYKLDGFTNEQNFLINSGQLSIMLSEALGNLPCLRELGLRDYNTPRKKARFGMDSSLLSYGWSFILQETGIDFRRVEAQLDDYDDRYVDTVFSATLLALARSRVRIDALTVDIRHASIGVSSSAFVIPAFFHRDIHQTLFNLKTLDLSVGFTQAPVGSYSSRCDSFESWQTHQLFSFLQETPNLSALRVRSKQKGLSEDGIIDWLSTTLNPFGQEYPGDRDRDRTRHGQYYRLGVPSEAPPMMLPQSRHHFQGLVELELASMSASTRNLQSILRSLSNSLRRLTLHKIALVVAYDDEDHKNRSAKPNAWRTIFSDMHNVLSLEQLSVSTLEHHTESCSGNNGHPVAFSYSTLGTQSRLSNGLLNAWSHRGTAHAVKYFLEELYFKTFIICGECRKTTGYSTVDEILAQS